MLLVAPQVLRQAGRPSEAQSLSEEALSLLQGQLGSDHPRVAAQLMILGQLAAQQNKQAVAEQTFRKALQVRSDTCIFHACVLNVFACSPSLFVLERILSRAGHATFAWRWLQPRLACREALVQP